MRTLLVMLLIVPAALSAETLVVREVLLGEREPGSRPAMQADRLERDMARGTWKPPQAGVADPNGVVWKHVRADEDGWIRDEALSTSDAYATVRLDEERTYVLEAMGYAGVFVNGEPRIGNVYGHTDDWEPWQPPFDYSLIPVRLKRGDNELLFFGSRYGLLRARLHAAESRLLLNARDTTLPDLVLGEAAETWGAIVVLNATAQVVTQAKLQIRLDGVTEEAPGSEQEGAGSWRVHVPPLPPFGVRKVGFPIHVPASDALGIRRLRVAVVLDEEVMDAEDLALQVKQPDANRRVTFVSAIDGSVQFYGYLPARGDAVSGEAATKRQAADGSQAKTRPKEKGLRDSDRKALFLSLHGAAVDALNQSGSYAPLSWGHVLAPTNRRPFGFNWEDWGRLDALEVLELGLKRLPIDPDRVYLTGHSMGGHGSWHVGSLHPDRFAAVGPSAGWISLWSYRMDEPPQPMSPLATLVERANLPSRTLEMAPNLAGLGVYVLHGAEDDNVPAAQAHLMLERLKEFHRDFVYHEEPGVGHWWDRSDEPGADCVTWAPMFDFFARHRRPRIDEVREVRFRTPSSRVSAWNHWVCVAAQQRPFVMSRVDLRLDPRSRHVAGTTENVATLGLSLSHVDFDSLWLDLDGESLALAVPSDGTVWLAREAAWRPIAAPDRAAKGMHRDGTFREAFGNQMQLVFGTQGTPEENAWALAKARADAEYLWYQGNASVDVLPDSLFDSSAEPERNVILYGNGDTHADWRELWKDDVVVVERGRMEIGRRQLVSDGLAVLAVRPRPGSTGASVGIVSGTGLAGFHLLDRRPYLIAGVAYPDLTLFEDRGDNEIVRAAGFFGNDWSLETGEIVWAEAP